MDRKSFSELLKVVVENINQYKKNVIDQKYENNLAELHTLLIDLGNLSDRYFQENRSNFTKEVIETLDSNASQAIDYIRKISNEMKHFILKDSNLNAADAESLLAQNNYIKNLSLNYEIQRMLGYYEKASLEALEKSDQREFEERFVICIDVEGNRHYILREHAEAYQKMVEMEKNISQILFRDLSKFQSLYNKKLEEKKTIDLGELSADVTHLEYYLLTENQIKEMMVSELKEIRKLSEESGMKEKYHFIIDGKGFQVIIPIGKKPIFEKHIQTLAELQSALKEQKEFLNVPDVLVDIQIDYPLLTKMTLHQKQSYLKSIMQRIENSQSSHMVTVHDYKNENKVIPVVYYSVYEECKRVFDHLSMTIDENYVNSLNDESKIQYYETIIDHIKKSTKEPFVMVDNVRVCAEYYKHYMNAVSALNSLRKNEKSSQQSDPISHENETGYREYEINESYVQTLSDELKLSYYANLIGRIATTSMGPAVVYESFGVKLNIPIGFVPTVQECERRALELKEKMVFQIRESKVHLRSPEMQYSYYGELIEKMKYSDKEPKIAVEAFGEKFEIPLACQDSFEDCVSRMESLTSKIGHAKRRRKIKKVKKSVTKKAQEFWKKKTNRVKLILGIGVLVGVGAISASIYGKQKNVDNVSSIARNTSIEQSIDDMKVSDQANTINNNLYFKIPEESSSFDHDRINQLAFNANQSLASSFGAVIKLNNEKISITAHDFSNATSIDQVFQNDLATIVKISVRMPDQSLTVKNFFDENAQQEVNQLIEQGGMIESVGIVALGAEQDYYKTGDITGYIQIDENTNLTSGGTTKLSQDVSDYVISGRGR